MQAFQANAFQGDAFESTLPAFGQATALIDSPIKVQSGQAQAYIKLVQFMSGQANAQIARPVPYFIAHSENYGFNNTVSVSKPTGTADGDLLLAFVSIGNPFPGPPSTVPSGYSLVGYNDQHAPLEYIYAKIASSEASSETWGSSTGFTVIRHAWRPRSGSWASVYDAIYGLNVNSSDNADEGQITIYPILQNGSADSVSITTLGASRSNTTLTEPSGYTAAGAVASTGAGDNGDNSTFPTSKAAYKTILGGTSSSAVWTNSNGRAPNALHISIIDPSVTRNMGVYGTLGADSSHGYFQGFSAGTSWDIVLPSAKQGCLLAIVIASNYGTVTTPSGWTGSTQFTNSDVPQYIQLFTKVATSDFLMGTTVNFTVSNASSQNLHAYVWVFQPGVSLIAVDGVADTSFNATLDVPGLTAVASNGILIAATNTHRGDGAGLASGPSGFTLQYQYRPGNAVSNGSGTAYKTDYIGTNPSSGSFGTAGGSTYTSVGLQALFDLLKPTASGQAQCYIKPPFSTGYGQAQADIKAINRGSAQAQAKILIIGNGSGQASALILHMSCGQAQALVVNTKKSAQAQARIVGYGQGYGQALADIRRTFSGSGQAQASITSHTPSGQAQAIINQSAHTGQAQADIKVRKFSIANAQALIKHFPVKWGQAQCYIRRGSQGSGQAQTSVTRKQGYGLAQCSVAQYKGSGQAQTRIKHSYYASGQATCFITRTQGYGQAQAAIKHGASGQAQAKINVANSNSGQARTFISKSKGSGQAQGMIINQNRATGQAQAFILKRIGCGQAQAYIKQKAYGSGQAQAQIGHIAYAQAQTFIASQRYLVKFNNLPLPGYAQSESFTSDESIQKSIIPYLDGSFTEYSGLQNKIITIRLKILSSSLLEAKKELQIAGTILRSTKGFTPLYVQYTNKHYLALTRKIESENTAKENTTFTDYTVEFEAKPWLIGETTWTISGTSLIDTGTRDYTNGGWTPARIKLSGTDITVSGYNELGEITGFISVSGAVNNLIINTEAYSATIGGINKNNLMRNLDYSIYIGPGKTYFVISGATSCEISWEDRYYL